MIFKKRQLVLLAAVALICTAVYLNWRFNSAGENIAPTDVADTTRTIGEAQLVNSDTGSSVDAAAASGSDYFSEARINRQKTRDQALDILKEVAANVQNTEDARKKAAEDMANLALSIEREGKIENLVKSKGFNDCVAVLSEDGVYLVVQSVGLQPNEAAQIKEIVVSETGLDGEKIKIIEAK